ncbi:hypothetical protein CEUSTIGMA_g10023.t1 [Chlamydomonas eustigma]|uniref:Calcineurin-like phosphoesterase domain-containing protein n=1 Tax=Chlamydomonas eustigma TaxID=1157962 RepID=A0A250XHN7_9CHLO|nr:hypothetical protein CEUSTIGMA_g10023.t1 [Chlamydomonas eustigma]|eukprot:GAX82597.1 hypothetical protein CEUSTIGMA_g10023.t1 [Chlamydomonas eustigma]
MKPATTDAKTKRCRLIVVGDVHDAWDERDEAALHSLQGDMVLFVGDFGNEAVQLVSQVAQLKVPKAVILGNHDAWYTMTPKARRQPLSQTLAAVEMLQQMEASNWRNSISLHHPSLSAADILSRKASSSMVSSGTLQSVNDNAQQQEDIQEVGAIASKECQDHPLEHKSLSCSTEAGHSIVDRQVVDAQFRAVEAQLQMLGSCHVGFSSLPVAGKGLSIVGGRPFAKVTGFVNGCIAFSMLKPHFSNICGHLNQ